MTFSRQTRVLLALGSGIALALSFPNYNLPWLAWISIGMLVLASIGAPPREAPLYGFLHAFVFYPICLPWIATVMKQYGNVPPLLSVGILSLFGIAGGIIWSTFSMSVAFVARRKGVALACVLAPFFWVTLEFARTHIPYIGFPWNLTGYAASDSLALLQLTTVTGIWGLSFLVAAYGSFLAYAVLVRKSQVWKSALVVTMALLFIAIGGSYLVPTAPAHHVAHLIQTNFPQSEQYPSDWMQIHAVELDQLAQISIDAAKKNPGLIVWPEVPAPFSMQDPSFASRMVRIAKESGNEFLVGVVDWKKNASGNPRDQWSAYNSAVLLDASGRRTYSYNKIHLVPFGEYVPLREWLTFAGRLTADISDFTPGVEYAVGHADRPFGTFICYEAIFPNEIRRFAANGAELLINISNDGWFGRSAAPAQHLMMSRVRAVESRRWMLRDTNNGYTVSVDPYGRIVARLPTDIRGELEAPYDFRSNITPYVRFGDWLCWLSLFASLLILGVAFARPTHPPQR
ncbi:MAG TPA: apolipoprotein N-acyltransferase [Candidatus Acidoferrales bacterium]|jgi:apolipoprotein N-acyltransferase